MVSRNLVICDQEERYAAALAHFFMKTKELALGVQVCNSVAQALRLQEESPIDILLIGSGYPQEERQKVRAESVFVLTQSEDVAHETHEKLINKYQSGEAILRDVIEQCQESVEPGNFFLGTVKKEKVRIIGIFSPVHRSRKTGYALRLGKDLAKTYNVSKNNDSTYIKGIKQYVTKSLNKALAPKESSEVKLNTSKLLTSTDDNEFNNQSEITEVKKTNGFSTGTPVKMRWDNGQNRFNVANAEVVTIVPSTGENRNYVTPIMIGIVTISMLGVGIVLIKKFVVK